MCVLRQLFLSLVLLFISQAGLGYDFSPNSRSQIKKDAQRWSLSQWMEQKSNFKLMDVWLNYNSTPSYSELYLGGHFSEYERLSQNVPGGFSLPDNEDLAMTTGYLGGFVSIFGLHGEYARSSDEDRTISQAYAMLRIMGATDQGTNLTAFYGLRDEEMESPGYMDSVQNQQVGGYLTLYIFRSFAIQGKYHHYFDETSDNGSTIGGHRMEASAWVEYGALRLYGTWYKEPLTIDSGSGIFEIERSGFNAGFRIYLDIKK